MKNLTLVFRDFGKEHLGKDVFLTPYYLGKYLNYEVTIVYPLSQNNKDFPKEIRGVKLLPLKSKSLLSFKLKSIKYLICNAHNIDLLMQIHWGKHMAIMAFIYKLLCSHGKTYIKLDTDNNARFSKWTYLKHFVRYIDVFTCETSNAYKEILQGKIYSPLIKSKLILMPNGFDEEYLKEMNLHECTFKEKENLIITVGRLGTFQKNTEMLLRALGNVDLRDWKVILLGPYDENFKKIISSFYKENPEKHTSVEFIGAIYDKKELWEYYNKAKVFVFTSRYESYGLVFDEAIRFKNYIVSTDTGIFPDLPNDVKFCISQNSDRELSECLNSIIQGLINIDVYHGYDHKSLSWEKTVKKIKI